MRKLKHGVLVSRRVSGVSVYVIFMVGVGEREVVFKLGHVVCIEFVPKV